MKLHGTTFSPNTRKAILAFMHKGVEFETRTILPGPDLKKPEYLKINPLGLMPALEDGDLTISDSNVILEYIEEKHPETPIMPSSPEDRAKARWLAQYAGAALYPACRSVFREVFLKPNLRKQPTDQEILDETVNVTFPPILDYLEAQTPEDGFFFGDTLSVADISVISMFITARYGGYSVDAGRWPKLAAYMKRAIAHPTVVKCIENEKEEIKSFAG